MSRLLLWQQESRTHVMPKASGPGSVRLFQVQKHRQNQSEVLEPSMGVAETWEGPGGVPVGLVMLFLRLGRGYPGVSTL